MINVGDVVRVVDNGVIDGWIYPMYRMVGHIFEVEDIDCGSYVINGYCFGEDEIVKIGSEHKAKLLDMLHDISCSYESGNFFESISNMQKYISENM